MAETIYFPRRLILAGAMISGVLAGLAALCLGATMAFCGALFALRKA